MALLKLSVDNMSAGERGNGRKLTKPKEDKNMIMGISIREGTRLDEAKTICNELNIRIEKEYEKAIKSMIIPEYHCK